MSEFDARAYIKRLPDRPGVYRMLDADGKIVYVGKARSLRSRVGSYFRADQVQPKVQALVRAVAGIEVTVTNSDIEALLLEHNLIKSHRPRFNVTLRDDKSTVHHDLIAIGEFIAPAVRGGRRGENGTNDERCAKDQHEPHNLGRHDPSFVAVQEQL